MLRAAVYTFIGVIAADINCLFIIVKERRRSWTRHEYIPHYHLGLLFLLERFIRLANNANIVYNVPPQYERWFISGHNGDPCENA